MKIVVLDPSAAIFWITVLFSPRAINSRNVLEVAFEYAEEQNFNETNHIKASSLS
jgi:hypothetical protein